MDQSASEHKPGIFLFSAFTFDVASGELLRNGLKLRIPLQTSRLLTVLLARAGSVVTREDLRQLLWPDGEFIDHEHAINRAINNLRIALRDDPKTPKFIETLPKRGYRFCADVNFVPAGPAASESVSSADLNASESVAPVTEPTLTVSPSRSSAPDAKLDHQHWSRHLTGPGHRRRVVTLLFVSLALLTAVAITLVFFTRERARPKVIRMGIVPFETQGPEAAQLAESFRLDLMDTISQLPNVELHAAHSLAHANHDDASLREIASTLHLDVLLTGQLTLEGNRIRLQLELIRGPDVAHIASMQYTGSQDELEKIRTRVQRDIFADLKLTGKPLQTVEGSTEDQQAYNSYLQARDSVNRRSAPSITHALQLYQAAIDRDPNFALAYSGMATAHLALTDYPGNIEHLSLARQFANNALRLDPKLAEAHAVLGGVAFRLDWNPALAESELRHAVELEPHQAVYHAWLSEILTATGRFEEGLEEIDKAIADDPLWQDVYAIDVLVSGSARQNARMIDGAKTYVRLFPASSDARDLLAWSYFTAGRYKEAVEQWRLMASMENDQKRVALEDEGWEAFQRGGITAYATLRVNAIKNGVGNTTRHPNDFVPSEWYALAGDRDSAVAELQSMVERHENDALDLAVNPMFANLHRDPRFLALLSRVGLTLPASFPKDPRRER